jgi:hypothetical protein
MSYLGDRCTPGSGPLLLPAMRQKLRPGNPLTQPGSPTIVLKESRMNVSFYFRGTMVALRRHQWICLFLAFFLLYNPFFAAPRSGIGLEVCRPASHRATVGASELQHFSPADGWGCLPAVSSTEAEVVLTLPDVSAQYLLVPPLLPHFSRQFFGPGLWFRPPPAS